MADRARAEYLALGIRPDHPDRDYVFGWVERRALWPNKVSEWFRQIADELGLPRIGVQGLRHSAVTWMLSSGAYPKPVAQRTGHDVVMMLRNCAHVSPAQDRVLAEIFAAALDEARANLT